MSPPPRRQLARVVAFVTDQRLNMVTKVGCDVTSSGSGVGSDNSEDAMRVSPAWRRAPVPARRSTRVPQASYWCDETGCAPGPYRVNRAVKSAGSSSAPSRERDGSSAFRHGFAHRHATERATLLLAPKRPYSACRLPVRLGFHPRRRADEWPTQGEPMRPLRLCPLAAGLLAGCATPGGTPAPSGPVVWPTGNYMASARLQYTTGSVRPGTSARRLVETEVRVESDGTISLTTGDGVCLEAESHRAAERNFTCGQTVFQLVLDGETIRGTATAPVTYWVRGWSVCTRWGKNESGQTECLPTEDHPDEERTARTTAKLSVVAAG